jgi:hypothetical protein
MRLGLLLVLGGLLEGDAFVRGGSQLPRLRRQLHIGGSGARARPTMKMVEDIVSLPRRYERWPLGDAQANPTNVQRPFSGLRGDIALRLPTYVDDWRAGLQAKTVGATLFLYFACLAPVVAFGGALQLATQGSLGIIECIISRGVCGMAYAVLAGQPMTFIGSAACEMRREGRRPGVCRLRLGVGWRRPMRGGGGGGQLWVSFRSSTSDLQAQQG